MPLPKSAGGTLHSVTKELLTNHEGKKDKVYRDGKGLKTIGIGHFVVRGEKYDKMSPSDTISEQVCMHSSSVSAKKKAFRQIGR